MKSLTTIAGKQHSLFQVPWVSWCVATVVGASSLACGALTRAEAKEALEEAQLYSEAASLIGNTVELSQNFSIGGAVDDAAENLRDFYESQLPCAEVSLESNSLLVDYGVGEETCTHKGMTFSGSHEVTVSLNDEREVIVNHVWTELENGEIEVSGTAQVTWAGGDDPSRTVEHDLVWTRISDGREAQGRGKRVQQPLDGDLALGFTVDGDASWEGESGTWDLSISDVEMRWRDPVPQEGTYLLETPFGKDLTLTFDRADSRTVEVRAETGRRKYEFSVNTPQ